MIRREILCDICRDVVLTADNTEKKPFVGFEFEKTSAPCAFRTGPPLETARHACGDCLRGLSVLHKRLLD